MAEYMFPTETIDLPSGGRLYPEGSPLRSGKIDIKYMTAKEEDILTSTNLIQKGVVIDKLMESLIVTPGVKPDDLLVGDLNAVMIAARILSYGKEYPVQLGCSECKTNFEQVVDLAALKTVEIDNIPDVNEYPCMLPTGIKITFKILTRADEKEIANEVIGMKKFNGAIEGDTSIRLKYMLASVNGNRDKKVIREFVDAMIIRDVRAFRNEYKKVCPDVDFDLNVECSNCGAQVKARLPFGPNFFWPDINV